METTCVHVAVASKYNDLFTQITKKVNSMRKSFWMILIVPLIYCTAASTRETPGSQGHPIVVNDAEEHQPAGHAYAAAARVAQNMARNPRREHPFARGGQLQEPRPPVVHQRNNFNRYYENRNYGNHGNHGGQAGYRGNGGFDREYHHHSNYMQGMPGTYYPGYGQCHLCGKFSLDVWCFCSEGAGLP